MNFRRSLAQSKHWDHIPIKPSSTPQLRTKLKIPCNISVPANSTFLCNTSPTSTSACIIPPLSCQAFANAPPSFYFHSLQKTNSLSSLKIISTLTRNISSSSSGEKPPSDWDLEYEELKARRNKSIVMHPDSNSQHILPGNFVLKKNPKTGVERKVLMEHALGYFWALKELSTTNNKPILSNESIIAAADAEVFPSLKGLMSLSDEVVDIPEFFVRNNRLKDATAQCTLVTISCKDFGSKLLPSWTEPFRETFQHGRDVDRYEIVRITINEGRIAKLLSPFIVSGTKKNVPESDHANTLLYYGDAEEMRDILRMHNIYTGYVFLVDGIGRVRWAGSGEGSQDEVKAMIGFAKELTRSPERSSRHKTSTGPRVGKKVPRNV